MLRKGPDEEAGRAVTCLGSDGPVTVQDDPLLDRSVIGQHTVLPLGSRTHQLHHLFPALTVRVPRALPRMSSVPWDADRRRTVVPRGTGAGSQRLIVSVPQLLSERR
ncbi:hypothetical protein GCM10010372_82600 [Streptomyces tauricus]|nr:hypothetical protein GCM10010372_82600 [Streptomyces tauricus]